MPYTTGTAWESENRSITAYLTILSGPQPYAEDDFNTISAIGIESELVSTKNLSFGNTCSTKATISLKKVKADFKSYLTKGTAVLLELESSASGATLGHNEYLLYIDEIESMESRETYTENGTTHYYNDITLVCYDTFYKTELPYVPTITISAESPKNLLTVAKDVMKVAGFTSTETKNYAQGFSTDLTIDSIPENVSCREMLGYLAGYQGGNCIFKTDYVNNEPYSYVSPVIVEDSTAKTITQDEQYMDEYIVGGNLVELNRVESGTADSIAVYPSNGEIGNSISYENPYIQNDADGLARVQAIQETVIATARAIQGISADSLDYTPMTIKWRGDPQILVGEMVKVEDKYGNTQYCLIMGKSISFDGGLSETYRCYGETEKSVSFTINPVMKQIERRLTQMEEAILEATEQIGDVEAMQAGVFDIIPNNDGTANIGWKIASNVNGHYILANINGIGFSSNGGQSFNAAAIYFDSQGNGHINGNFIAANSITTDQIAVGTGSSGLTQALRDLANSEKTTHYCTCSTGSSTTEKAVSCTDEITSLTKGMMISVYFSNANTASSPTINLNNLGAKSISAQGNLYNWKAGSTLTFTYSGTNWVMTNLDTEAKLRALCSNNDMTYIAGANIATGSITASQIASNTITASQIATNTITTDRLNVGSGLLVEKFVSPELSGENKNWIGSGCSVYRVYQSGSYWLGAIPNSSVSAYRVMQYAHLEAGKRYRFTTNFLMDAVSRVSSAFIGTVVDTVDGGSSWSTRTGDNEAIEVGASTAQQMVYSFEFNCDETNTYAIGISINGIYKSSSAMVSTYFKWFSLVEIPRDSTLDLEYLSYSNWVSSQYRIDYSSDINFYKTDFSLTVDNNGNLLTLGELSSSKGTVGCFAFDNNGANVSSVSSYLAGSTYYHTDTIQFIKPDSYISSFSRSLGTVYRLSEAFNRLELVSYAGELNTSNGAISNFDLEGETIVTPIGVAVSNGSNVSEMRAASTTSAAFNVFSKEEIKKDITEKKSVVSLFKDSKIYDYEMKSDKSGNRRTGFVIGRETPEEIISEDGNGIDLYSTISITWKAVQEILERLDKIEGEKI